MAVARSMRSSSVIAMAASAEAPEKKQAASSIKDPLHHMAFNHDIFFVATVPPTASLLPALTITHHHSLSTSHPPQDVDDVRPIVRKHFKTYQLINSAQ